MNCVGWKIKQLKVFNLKTTDEIKEKLRYIQPIAHALHWTIEKYENKIKKITYKKDDIVLTIALDKNDVKTTLLHPSFLRKTVLMRNNLSMEEIASILFDARSHTGKGKNLTIRKRKKKKETHEK